MKDMIKLRDIKVNYGKKIALQGVSAEFEENSVYAVVGKSGSGKSTLAKAVAGILAYEGTITIGGEPLSPRVHRLALVPQSHGLIPWKTVEDNITLPLKERGVFDYEAMVAVTEELGIDHLLTAWPNHISGGEQQRVAMARAFLSRPHLLILDEAFSALDAITKEEAHAVFLKAGANHRVTTLLITHDVDEALTLAHHVLVLKEGTIAGVFANSCRGKNRDEASGEFSALCRRIKEAL